MPILRSLTKIIDIIEIVAIRNKIKISKIINKWRDENLAEKPFYPVSNGLSSISEFVSGGQSEVLLVLIEFCLDVFSLYLFSYSQAKFCLEEVLLAEPQNWLNHLQYAEVC